MNKIFGEMMCAARKEHGLTQAELSRRVGMSVPYCSEIENGIYTPTWIIWLKICHELDIDINSLTEKYIKPEMVDLAKMLGIELK